MRFARRRPCRALQHLVKFYWMVEDADPGPDASEIVVPDGCMEMIFHFGTPFSSIGRGIASEEHPRAFVGGQITRAICIRPQGTIGMLGVRFHPFGAQPLLGLAMDEIAGATIDLAEFAGAAARETIERLIDAGDPGARFDVVESLLLRLAREVAPADALAQASVGMMIALHGTIPVHQMAAHLRVSPRHLNRTLRRHVGLAPKALARILRLQYALAQMNRDRAATLTDAACAAGYFDQAHFIRDFRDVCGVSPGVFIGERHDLNTAFA